MDSHHPRVKILTSFANDNLIFASDIYSNIHWTVTHLLLFGQYSTPKNKCVNCVKPLLPLRTRDGKHTQCYY